MLLILVLSLFLLLLVDVLLLILDDLSGLMTTDRKSCELLTFLHQILSHAAAHRMKVWSLRCFPYSKFTIHRYCWLLILMNVCIECIPLPDYQCWVIGLRSGKKASQGHKLAVVIANIPRRGKRIQSPRPQCICGFVIVCTFMVMTLTRLT